MSYQYQGDSFYCEQVALETIATAVGTPCYVYSQKSILDRYKAYDDAFGDLPHRVCYAVKANSNLSILRLLAEAGAGFDIVSGGELFRVLHAGGDPSGIVFSGVGKTTEEIEYALREKIHTFNCESPAELEAIDAAAGRLGQIARIALRVNPDVDAATHPYISTGMSEHKFGIDINEVEAVYKYAAGLPNLEVVGVSCHIGSQLLDPAPILEAIAKLLTLVDSLRTAGIGIRVLDLGGGIGVSYRPSEQAPEIAKVVGAMRKLVEGRNLEVHVEPGRSIVGESGVLLTRVLYRKQTTGKQFIVVDAAMNDLIRPALYKSHHEILPLRNIEGRSPITADVVGPVCESADFLARDRDMLSAESGDLLAVATAGAYGFVQSSNYNSRPRGAEVLVDGNVWKLIRRKEDYADLIRGE